MAYGIEEIAEMQVTGPVKGGDMVMKPDQAPVGAAALLNKMQKKNTPGVFKLPSPDKAMPDFMKVAVEGVEEQNTANLENQEIMRIMGQYGVGPDEAKRIYDEMIYGYERDEAAVAPNDWRTILKMIESGMSQEEIDAQLALGEIRKDTQKVAAFAPEGEQLAYINKEEADILKLMGGSGEREPITGIRTYGLFDDLADVATGAKDKEDTHSYNLASAGAGQYGSSGNQQNQASNVIDTFNTVQEQVDTGGGYQVSEDQKGQTQDEIVAALPDPIIQKDEKEESKDGTGITDFLKNQGMNMIGMPSFTFEMMDAAGKFMSDWEEERVRKMLEKSKAGKGNMGDILARMRDDPDRFKDWFAKRGDIFDEVYGSEASEGGQPAGSLDDQEKFDFLVERFTGNKDFDKRYNPEKYYKAKPGENTEEYQRRMRKEGKYDPKALAQAQAEGKVKFSRANTQMIEEGRRLLEQDRDGGRDRHPGTGTPAEQITKDTEDTETITPDERAGSWNLGGTMPYTDDLYTQGTEMDVPLGKRFDIDKDKRYLTSNKTKDDMYKYATEGGYSQLEPFQNYLARRREYLGEQPDEWFDEEGNVIYSSNETV